MRSISQRDKDLFNNLFLLELNRYRVGALFA